jgi:hypothetical protein
MQREITQDEIGEATKTYLEWTRAEDFTPKSLIIIGMASKGEQLAVMQVVIGRRNWIARAFASLIKNSSDMREVLTEVIGASLFNKILENKMTKVSNKKVTVSNEGKLRDSYVN